MSRHTGIARTGLTVAALLTCCSEVTANIAGFDTLEQGPQGETFMENGITFSNGTWFPNGVPLDFKVGSAKNMFANDPKDITKFFSPPNVMVIGSLSDGPVTGLVRAHGFEATLGGQLSNFASLDVFYSLSEMFAGTELALEAWLGDELVASDSVVASSDESQFLDHAQLQISGVTFDRVQFVASGGNPEFPGENDGIPAVFDNMQINAVPGPTALGLFGLALFRGRRRRYRETC